MSHVTHRDQGELAMDILRYRFKLEPTEREQLRTLLTTGRHAERKSVGRIMSRCRR